MIQSVFRAIGLMSGTSMDGIDCAMIETDGYDYVKPLAFKFLPYEDDFRARLRSCIGNRDGSSDFHIAVIERELTELHIKVVKRLLEDEDQDPEYIDVIGFHGHTIWHQPEQQKTIQIGDGEYLARQTSIPVINNFRSADIAAGGQGAPLVPLYHRALSVGIPKPIAIVNIGGVSNITCICGDDEEDVIAFDTGPGNALLDDWMLHYAGKRYDKDGNLAATGKVDEKLIERFLQHEYFAKKPPKSLDRDTFRGFMPQGLAPADGAATLTMMTAQAIAQGVRILPSQPSAIYLSGGGSHNLTLRRMIGDILDIPVKIVKELGWDRNALEAEAFAYLAVRSLQGLPLTMPKTTGVLYPVTGGVLHEVARQNKKHLLAQS